MIVFVSFNNVYDIDIREKKNPIPLILRFLIEGNQLDIQQYLTKQTEKTETEKGRHNGVDRKEAQKRVDTKNETEKVGRRKQTEKRKHATSGEDFNVYSFLDSPTKRTHFGFR